MSGSFGVPIQKDMERDYFMRAKEAVAYGIVDAIIGEEKMIIPAKKKK